MIVVDGAEGEISVMYPSNIPQYPPIPLSS